MIMKCNACASVLLGLSSALSILVITPLGALAAPLPEATSRAKSQGTENLRQGIPGRRLGGGTRSGRLLFTSAYAQLAALVPENNLSITTAAQPTLLLHIPEMVSEEVVEFILLDSQDNVVYEQTFPMKAEGGIVSLGPERLPDLPSLALNEDYQWYFSIVANREDRSNDVVVHGSIRRVDLGAWLAQQPVEAGFSGQLATAEPLTKVQMLYQQANLWLDAAVALNELRQKAPEDPAIASEWTRLLGAQGLPTLPGLSEPSTFAATHTP